jgi:phosphomannomutase/phosphoglucomutase
MAKINKYMFREYDIRGRESKDELNPITVSLIAKSYGTFLRKRGIKKAVLGHDNRKSSEDFYAASKGGLLSTGVDVIGIGMILTPMMSWAQYYFKTKGGVIISASHNPIGWNGLKLGYGYSNTLVGDEVQELYRNIVKENFEKGKGSFSEENIDDEYIDDLVTKARLHRKLKVLINTGNATSSFISPKLLRKFGCKVVEHNTNPDPSYPNYPPNPARVDMMEDTAAQTTKNKCDVGLGVDADGDRLGVCDEQGSIIWPDRWFILLSRLILKKHPGAKIIFDVKVSEALPEDIKAHGGVPIMWKTGYSYIKRKLHQEKAAAAGEMSGHIFFVDDFYGFDDANFAALKLLEYISSKDRPLSKLIKDTPYYVSTPTLHASCPDENKYKVVEEITEEFKKDGYKVIDINGARVQFGDGWGLVRASSNLPALVIRFEAKTEKRLKEIEKFFREKLRKYKEVGTKWESG